MVQAFFFATNPTRHGSFPFSQAVHYPFFLSRQVFSVSCSTALFSCASLVNSHSAVGCKLSSGRHSSRPVGSLPCHSSSSEVPCWAHFRYWTCLFRHLCPPATPHPTADSRANPCACFHPHCLAPALRPVCPPGGAPVRPNMFSCRPALILIM